MATIKQIFAREILNGKGNPTVETTVLLDNGFSGTASVPIGTSVGIYEAAQLFDHDEARFKGLGVLKAIQNIITVITPKLIGMDITHQQEIDKIMIELDGTSNKERLGVNAILSVSTACAKAAAVSLSVPLYTYLRQFLSKKDAPVKIPIPLLSLINGSSHNSPTLNFQEFLIMPATSTSYDDGLQMAFKTYNAMKEELYASNYPRQISDQGGFCPPLAHNMEAFFLISKAIEKASLRMGFDLFLGIDAAATNFCRNQEYKISDKDGAMSAKSFTMYYDDLVKQFHILYLEDPLAEDDWEGWTEITRVVGQNALIVSDDLTATNPYRLQTAIEKKAISGIAIKPSQIGTVIETLAVAEVASASGLKLVVSNRSGETNDDFIADLSVAVGADYVKCGAPARGEHVVKYNRLLEISNHLKGAA